MTNEWPYPGSRWWKFDFHTHTPASMDTPWYKQTPALTPEEWLLKFMEAEIDCVAITDHNSGAWIDPLKTTYARMEAAAREGNPHPGFRKLHLFPGVELSVHGGIHMLAILPTSAGTGDIDRLLGAVGYRGVRGDTRDDVTTQSATEVVAEIVRASGIPIPAHVDCEKGLFGPVSTPGLPESEGASRPTSDQSVLGGLSGGRRLSGDANSVRQVVDLGDIVAMEWRSSLPGLAAHDRLRGRWADVLGSDWHGRRGQPDPGAAYTWVKMATPTTAALQIGRAHV